MLTSTLDIENAEDLSTIFTKEERQRLTVAEKASWRAKQADLHTKRKNFHGAVTYMFDGIFCWQMYGSADALDEYGNTYTEYLMRCQWGTTFDNLQPWIVAHRYREFDKLDADLKKKFSYLEKNMPKLPKKEFFRNMRSDVVSRRRQILEEYMTKIVTSMPSLMKSDIMERFLRINERIIVIRSLLNIDAAVPLKAAVTSEEESKEYLENNQEENQQLNNNPDNNQKRVVFNDQIAERQQQQQQMQQQPETLDIVSALQ